MPAPISWAVKIPKAIELLQQSPAPLIGRAQLEEYLGVSKGVAWRVMRRVGPVRAPGGAYMIERPKLIAALRKLASEGEVAYQLDKRDRLTKFIDTVQPFVSARSHQLVRPDQALQTVSSRFQNLPGNVTFTPREFRIEFCGIEDFLQAVGWIVFALQNDYGRIAEFIEERQ